MRTSSFFLPILLFLLPVPVLATDNPFAEKMYLKILDAQAIQSVVWADVRGNGKKDALVIYTKPPENEHAIITGGVAVFDRDKGLLWQWEKSCYSIGGDVLFFDKDNPKLPFVRVMPCANASIGCGMFLFRWDGTTFQPIYNDGYGNDHVLMAMPDGVPVMQAAWRGRGVPNLIRYEAGKVVDCSGKYPAFYRTYIQKAQEALTAKKWPDLEPMLVEQNYLRAFIYAGQYQAGLDFLGKLRPLMVEQDQLREGRFRGKDSGGPKAPDDLFMKELDSTVASYEKMEQAFEQGDRGKFIRVIKNGMKPKPSAP